MLYLINLQPKLRILHKEYVRAILLVLQEITLTDKSPHYSYVYKILLDKATTLETFCQGELELTPDGVQSLILAIEDYGLELYNHRPTFTSTPTFDSVLP